MLRRLCKCSTSSYALASLEVYMATITTNLMKTCAFIIDNRLGGFHPFIGHKGP